MRNSIRKILSNNNLGMFTRSLLLTLLADLFSYKKHINPKILRKCSLNSQDVLPYLNKRIPALWIAGKKINARSKYLLTFKHNGCVCRHCGVEGTILYLERCQSERDWHLKIYGIDKNGQEVLMTRDHIIPLSKGGKNGYMNIQPLCIRCNRIKSNNDNMVPYVPYKKVA